MGCVFSKQRWGKERNSQPTDPPKTRDSTEDAEILSITEVSVPCEAISVKPSFQNQMNIPPSRDSVESVMERLMDRHYDFDLTYITERIISVLFLSDLEEQRYSANLKEVAAMLKCKHQDKFLLINLSEKRHDICKLNPKVEEFGWPDLHALPLDKICAVCKTMECWLACDPQNVVVLHCKGNKGKTGVIVAAYMHYSKISAGADQALSTVAMKKFCEDKISPSLQPSQNRYIYYFASLLSGAMKMNSSSLFLYQIYIPALLNYQSGGGYSPFLKIYQSLQLVYSSAKYDIQGPNSKMLCMNIEPALLLKGDILVKCYHRHSGVSKKECVFRVQFHTCSVHESQLAFGKGELDHACTDDHFPADATVELVFSSGPQKARGGELQSNEPGVTVDYCTTDPVVRWDSYEKFNLHHQDSVEDGGIKVLEADKCHIKAFSSSTQDCRPLEDGDPVKSIGQECETLPGSLITVVITVNGETIEKTEPQHSEAKERPIVESTSNTAPLCPNSALTYKRVESVQVQTYTPSSLSNSFLESEQNKDECPCSCYTTTSASVGPPISSSERSSASEFPSFNINAERQSLSPLTDCTSSNGESSNSDLRASSPDPDDYVTPSFPIASYSYSLLTVPHVLYTGYTAVTIPASLPQPPLPEKQRSTPLQNVFDCSSGSSLKSAAKPPTSAQFHVSFSSELPVTARHKATPSSGVEEMENHLSSKFVQDSSKYWYKPGISRDQAIAVLKDKEPGCFIIRDSNSFQGAYGLALKVATPLPHASNHGEKGSPQEQLVRHFLIESGAKGVKIKGCQNETYFGSLSALVYQHSITPVSLPCVLRIPDKDLVRELQELQSGTNTSTAADLLKQGAACNVLYLNSVETDSLTGPQAVSKATMCTLTQEPRPSPTVVHFKVSTQGITLTDNQRRLFFRRHYPIQSVTFSSVDPLDRRWTDADNPCCKMFGFVARRNGGLGNVCHLFAEHDPEQPATAIVNFINKVMLGPQQL
ncbi:tensin-2-like isoform X3 [Myxocyprinus asiaticus]|uniref:tensin-2-like isoform X3 n=1 Tax=Myxocyprinus asiaticus TaxID=70543 RepID=UPI002222F394|nr:tensin-2-like isoform X3 [Myxocyprinus asiaticus]